MNGVIAATLARNDFVGATESVEGKHGLLAGYTDDAHPDKAVAELGKTYETMKIGVKPYPSCRYTHAAIDECDAILWGATGGPETKEVPPAARKAESLLGFFPRTPISDMLPPIVQDYLARYLDRVAGAGAGPGSASAPADGA